MSNDLTISPLQERLNWCWAAVASTVVGYFLPQSAMSQCEVARTYTGESCCNAPNDCNVTAALEDVFTKLNSSLKPPLKQSLSARPLTWAEIQTAIDAGSPICGRIDWIGGGSHFVLVTGYSVSATQVSWVDVSDPYLGDLLVPLDFFTAQYLFTGRWDASFVMSLG